MTNDNKILMMVGGGQWLAIHSGRLMVATSWSIGELCGWLMRHRYVPDDDERWQEVAAWLVGSVCWLGVSFKLALVVSTEIEIRRTLISEHHLHLQLSLFGSGFNDVFYAMITSRRRKTIPQKKSRSIGSFLEVHYPFLPNITGWYSTTHQRLKPWYASFNHYF